MTFAFGLSEHPLATHAVGEVIGQVADGGGQEPDLAVLFATGPHTGVLEDMVKAVQTLIKPKILVGTTAVSVLGGPREAEDVPALSLWTASIDGAEGVRINAQRSGDGISLIGFPTSTGISGTLLLLADPFSFPVDGFLQSLATNHPDLTVVGGLSSAARGPGGNRLVLDDNIYTDGAVGILLPPECAVATVVSQGCRPVGEPFVVTAVEGNHILELGGRPAVSRLQDLVNSLDEEARVLLQSGLHIGVVRDESKLDYARGDFLIRGVLGIDRDRGSVAVGDVVEIGTIVQFQVRDAASAHEDLHELLWGAAADAALVFTCNGRGAHLFQEPNHDAEAVSEALAGAPIAGMFCAGEIGPVAGENFVHGFTASVVLFS